MIQQLSLQWLMDREDDKEFEIERARLEGMALAFNPTINPKLIQLLNDQREGQEEEDVDWKTPQSQEEIQEVIQMFQGLI